MALAHIALAALTTGGVFVAGISAWHFAKGTRETALFRSSLRLGVWVGMLSSFFVIIVGNLQLPVIERTQPTKAALLDGGGWVKNSMDLMTILGNTVSTITFVAAFLLLKDVLVRKRWLAYSMTAMIPLPFIASVGGWVVREMGRQPWLVYGELTVEDALSKVGRGSLLVSCTVFIALFAALAVTNWTLITRFARLGPDGAQLGGGPGDGLGGGLRADEKPPVPAF